MKKIITLIVAVLTFTGVQAEEKTVWEGNEPISWNPDVAPGTQFETPEGIFTALAKGDVIRVYTTTTYDEPQYVLTYKAGDGWEWTDLDVTMAEGIISYTVASEQIATEIAERGLVFRGQAYSITKITVTKESSTGIQTVANSQQATSTADGHIYNLTGQMVGESYKGVSIKNGRKYILK